MLQRHSMLSIRLPDPDSVCGAENRATRHHALDRQACKLPAACRWRGQSDAVNAAGYRVDQPISQLRFRSVRRRHALTQHSLRGLRLPEASHATFANVNRKPPA